MEVLGETPLCLRLLSIRLKPVRVASRSSAVAVNKALIVRRRGNALDLETEFQGHRYAHP